MDRTIYLISNLHLGPGARHPDAADARQREVFSRTYGTDKCERVSIEHGQERDIQNRFIAGALTLIARVLVSSFTYLCLGPSERGAYQVTLRNWSAEWDGPTR